MSPKKIKIGLLVIFLLITCGILILNNSVPKPLPVPPSKLATNSLLAMPNFFLGEDGKWYHIDTQIIESNDPEYSYMNITNNFKTYFPGKINKSKNIKFQRADAWVNFNVISLLTIKKIDDKNQEKIIAQKTIGNFNPIQGQIDTNKDIKNKFSYPKIYQDGDKSIDINYTIYSYKLSEEMVLNKFLGFPELTQHLSLHNVYVKVDGPNINFFHEQTGELLWFIAPPKMYEQVDQSKFSYGLTYDIKCDNSRISLDQCRELTITKKFTDEGKKWIADSSRQFPVVLDPDFQINSADNSTNWVSSDTANFTISQETTIKHEGTGAVKVIASPKCWQSGGTCTATCQYNALGTSVTAYSGCTSTSCGSSNCWGISGSCDAGCTASGYSTGSVNTSCGAGVSCDGNCWGILGSCDASCLAGGVAAETLYTGCASGTYCP